MSADNTPTGKYKLLLRGETVRRRQADELLSEQQAAWETTEAELRTKLEEAESIATTLREDAGTDQAAWAEQKARLEGIVTGVHSHVLKLAQVFYDDLTGKEETTDLISMLAERATHYRGQAQAAKQTDHAKIAAKYAARVKTLTGELSTARSRLGGKSSALKKKEAELNKAKNTIKALKSSLTKTGEMAQKTIEITNRRAQAELETSSIKFEHEKLKKEQYKTGFFSALVAAIGGITTAGYLLFAQPSVPAQKAQEIELYTKENVEEVCGEEGSLIRKYVAPECDEIILGTPIIPENNLLHSVMIKTLFDEVSVLTGLQMRSHGDQFIGKHAIGDSVGKHDDSKNKAVQFCLRGENGLQFIIEGHEPIPTRISGNCLEYTKTITMHEVTIPEGYGSQEGEIFDSTEFFGMNFDASDFTIIVNDKIVNITKDYEEGKPIEPGSDLWKLFRPGNRIKYVIHRGRGSQEKVKRALAAFKDLSFLKDIEEDGTFTVNDKTHGTKPEDIFTAACISVKNEGEEKATEYRRRKVYGIADQYCTLDKDVKLVCLSEYEEGPQTEHAVCAGTLREAIEHDRESCYTGKNGKEYVQVDKKGGIEKWFELTDRLTLQEATAVPKRPLNYHSCGAPVSTLQKGGIKYTKNHSGDKIYITITEMSESAKKTFPDFEEGKSYVAFESSRMWRTYSFKSKMYSTFTEFEPKEEKEKDTTEQASKYGYCEQFDVVIAPGTTKDMKTFVPTKTIRGFSKGKNYVIKDNHVTRTISKPKRRDNWSAKYACDATVRIQKIE